MREKMFVIIKKSKDDERYNFGNPERGLFVFGPFKTLEEAKVSRENEGGRIFELKQVRYIILDPFIGSKIKEDWLCRLPASFQSPLRFQWNK